MRLPKNLVSSRRLNTDIADEIRTAKVVVFIPPAVDPGEPPVSIRISIITIDPCFIMLKFTVLNPAVLGVTA